MVNAGLRKGRCGGGGRLATFANLYFLNTWKGEMKEIWQNIVCLTSAVHSCVFPITSWNCLCSECVFILNHVLVIFKSWNKSECQHPWWPDHSTTKHILSEMSAVLTIGPHSYMTAIATDWPPPQHLWLWNGWYIETCVCKGSLHCSESAQTKHGQSSHTLGWQRESHMLYDLLNRKL